MIFPVIMIQSIECMNILITNDDGIYSPGIASLARVASHFGKVRVVAPDVEQSSMGQAITASRPLMYKKSPVNFDNDIEAIRVNGTPSDCVALGLHLWKETDVILSGINLGLNVGNSMWHSGTLAGAKQAVLFGVKGIALSTSAGDTEPDFPSLEAHVKETLSLLLQDKIVNLTNVNFPKKPRAIKAIKYTRQAVQLYDGLVVPGKDPRGKSLYWFTIMPLGPAEEGTDRWAVDNGYTSITPLRLDLTNEQELIRLMNQQPVDQSIN
jgi:5'-nucleotidase